MLHGDFETGTGILKDVLGAREARPYLAKIIRFHQAQQTEPPPSDPSLPAWIIEARAAGYPVLREGKYWRFAGGLFDDGKQQVGN